MPRTDPLRPAGTMNLAAPGLRVLRSPRWKALFALFALLGMLLLFGRVVRQAVEQGELRRQAQAALAQATWRCRMLADSRQRQACLQQLAEVPRENAALRR